MSTTPISAWTAAVPDAITAARQALESLAALLSAPPTGWGSPASAELLAMRDLLEQVRYSATGALTIAAANVGHNFDEAVKHVGEALDHRAQHGDPDLLDLHALHQSDSLYVGRGNHEGILAVRLDRLPPGCPAKSWLPADELWLGSLVIPVKTRQAVLIHATQGPRDAAVPVRWFAVKSEVIKATQERAAWEKLERENAARAQAAAAQAAEAAEATRQLAERASSPAAAAQAEVDRLRRRLERLEAERQTVA